MSGIVICRSIQKAQEFAAQIEGEVQVVALDELNQGRLHMQSMHICKSHSDVVHRCVTECA